MHGLCELFKSELGVETRAAENAETAAADGMRKFLFLRGERGGGTAAEYAMLLGEPCGEDWENVVTTVNM